VVLFTMLPVGVRRTENPEPGTEAGAPEHPHLWRKALATTVITGVITTLIYVLAEAGWLPVRAWLAPHG
jgi:predicted secreted protein